MINRVGQSVENEIPRRLAETTREAAALKSKQLTGADVQVIGQSDEGSLSQLGLGAGAKGALIVNLYGTQKVRYLSELKFAFFIDHDANPDYGWPYGIHALPSQLEIGGPYVDLAYSDETGAGNKTYIITYKNPGGAPIDLYIHWAVIYPQQTLTL